MGPSTVINAVAETETPNGRTEYMVRVGVHIGLWLVAIAFQCVMGFNVSNHLDGCVVSDVWSNVTNTSAVMYGGPSVTTVNIGIIGATSTLIGVALVLAVGAAVAMGKNNDWENMLMPYMLFFIQFFTVFGTVCAFYIFSQAAQFPDICSGYGASVAGVGFMLLAQLVLYSNVAAVKKESLPRNLLPAAVLSVQLVSYFAIASGDFAPHATDGQKTAALLSPISTVCALVLLMVFSTKLTDVELNYHATEQGTKVFGDSFNSIKTQHVPLDDSQPLRRAAVMFIFTVTGMLSVYKLSFVAVSPDSTSYMFCLADAILTLLTLTIMFVDPVPGPAVA
jgi:hypothetical protein